MDTDVPTEASDGDRAARRSWVRRHRTALIVAVGAIVLLLAWRLLFHHEKTTPPLAPLGVQTMTVSPHAVPEVIETSGTIISPQTVEVRPQADGVLQSVRIHDGDQVRKGQLLFTIDPRPLRAALAQASATLTRDQALARDAADTAARYKPLAAAGAVDTKSYVTAANNTRSLLGTVASDRAQIAQARLSLAYTSIRAPISGRAGAIQVKPGNVVTANSTTALVTINVGSPIEASFALPRVQVDAVRRADAGRSGGLAVLALDPNTGRVLDRGQLYFLDNAFDDSSGTLTVRARFTNPGQGLWPGQFVTIRVILSQDPNALSVPESALQQGQEGPYVYVFANGKAAFRQLAVARMIDGQAVVTKGLKAGDTVILTVPNELRDGSAVRSSNQPKLNPAATATPAATK
ncbi:MAG: efflux RND transporter periplasmic adaptor subunit [Sphingomonas sp.]|uniref:efflux RND transporter periplasmic adaptor subunit n=1 Tax=Sphingomonas sp. TaxID=28214 RepID=UPI001AC9C0D8|nr:efflux RND transporter periplasmic adaptor subunit [Sphingomonas sp.]MBN8808707.1 efflux RND transporter periplasmic adaptor subunit [Sphingomonas sp.]